MPHPADRDDRRRLDRQHPPYDGERKLIRDMQRAYDRMQELDRKARLQEWDQSVALSVPGWLVVFAAENILADL